MKHIPILFVVLTLTCAAQQPFDWPFQPGDRVVIGETLMRFEERAKSFYYPEDHPYDSLFIHTFCVNVSRGHIPIFGNIDSVGWSWNHTKYAGISRDGLYVLRGSYHVEELFPIIPPSVDTLWLRAINMDGSSMRTHYCTNTRRFDTTVFGRTISAFSSDVYDMNDAFQYRISIGDTYWILSIDTQPNEERKILVLNKYKIGTRRHDIGPYTLKFPPICKDLKYHYYGEYWDFNTGGHNESYCTFRDTLINGKTYCISSVGTISPFIGTPLTMPVRNSGSNLLAWTGTTDTVLYPFSADLGDSVRFGWLHKIDSTDFQGKRLRFVFDGTYPVVDAGAVEIQYCSGIGRTRYSDVMDPTLDYYYFDLKDYTPCPFDPSAVPNLPSLPRWQAVVYPSPAKSYITLSIQHAATAAPLSGTLMITDELGRTVLSQQWNEVTEHSALTFPVAGFAPGVYYYRLVCNNAWLAGQFVVER